MYISIYNNILYAHISRSEKPHVIMAYGVGQMKKGRDVPVCHSG